MRQINVYNPRENRKRELYPGRSSRLQIFHQRKMAFIFGNISQRSSNQDYGVEDTVHWTVLTRGGHILSITPWDRETGRNQEQSSDLCHWIPHQSQAGRDCPRFQTTPLTGKGILNTKIICAFQNGTTYRIMKNIFGFRKTVYRGLRKNLNRLHVLFASANL